MHDKDTSLFEMSTRISSLDTSSLPFWLLLFETQNRVVCRTATPTCFVLFGGIPQHPHARSVLRVLSPWKETMRIVVFVAWIGLLVIAGNLPFLASASSPDKKPPADAVSSRKPTELERGGCPTTSSANRSTSNASSKITKANFRPLRDFFRDGRPVILTLNYYNCPMLCTMQLNGLVSSD
jgi:hypothetical protein